MKLFVNKPSPYARKVVVAALESGLGGAVEIAVADPWQDPLELLAVNPVGKVPALVLDDGSVLLESTAIGAYLLERGGRTTLPLEERVSEAERTGLAQGLIDASYGVVLERRRPEDRQWQQWVERQQRVIGRLLEVIQVPPGDRFDLGDISLACGLGYLDFRLPEVAWRRGNPAMAEWLDNVSRRPSMVASVPR